MVSSLGPNKNSKMAKIVKIFQSSKIYKSLKILLILQILSIQNVKKILLIDISRMVCRKTQFSDGQRFALFEKSHITSVRAFRFSLRIEIRHFKFIHAPPIVNKTL